MLEIRSFVREDLEEIVDITRTRLHEIYPSSFFLTISHYWPEGVLVALDRDRVVGFIIAVISGVKQARILMLAVRETHTRMGIATSLIRELISEALMKGLDSIHLEVRVSNAMAINLYTRLGFKIVGHLRGYYRDGENGIRMERTLQS